MNKLWTIAISTLAAAVVAGCSSNLKPVSQSNPSLTMSANQKYMQVQDADTVKTKVVKQYVPVPVAGQLMEKPDVNSVHYGIPTARKAKRRHRAKKRFQKRMARKHRSAQSLVMRANQHAVQQVKRNDFFNAMMTYNFMPGALYTVYTAPLRLTDVTLQTGEKIISIAAGDTLRWQISQTYSGQGQNRREHIIVKPNSASIDNTILVTTNRRVYHLVLKSTKNDTYMVQVKWHYASSPLVFVSQKAQGYGPENTVASTGSDFKLDLGRLDFKYEFGTVKGNKPAWYPTRVFNDGRQTFIEFPKDFYNANMPVLYVSDNGKSYGTMVNWRLKGRYMVVDHVIADARLQSGVKSKKDQTVVQIQHL